MGETLRHTQIRFRFGVVGLVCILFTGCSLARFERGDASEPSADCNPHFGDANGWYGGDGAFSVALGRGPEAPSLWLFGDTFVERRHRPGARAYPFVANSIGLSRCDPRSGFMLETRWRQEADAAPRAFFKPPPDAAWVRSALARSGRAPWYWPFGGFRADGQLYVGLLRVAHAAPNGPLRLPFRLLGMDLASIDADAADPLDWNVRIRPLVEAGGLIPTGAFAVEEEFVHAISFAHRADGRSPRGLIRWRLEALTSPDPLPGRTETWSGTAGWIPGNRPDRAEILFPESATEMSVHWEPRLTRWLAVGMEPGPWQGADEKPIRIRTAERLTGPWTPPRPAYHVPPARSAAIRDNRFCYAGKAHPQFSRGDDLVLTYVCNLYARSEAETESILGLLRDTGHLYRATAVSIPLSSLSASSSAASRSVSEAASDTDRIGVGTSRSVDSTASPASSISVSAGLDPVRRAR